MQRLFFQKIRNRLAHEKNRLWRYLPIEVISLSGSRRLSGKEVFLKRLHRTIGPINDVFLQSIPDGVERLSILKEADAAYNHLFDLLGSGPKHLQPINWHSDFKSGYIWEKGSFYQDYNVDVKTDEVDGKVPWELNRFQHFLWLAEAYKITTERKYAQEIVDEITDWIDENPLMYSVNWTCSMDVAFRAVNWIYAISLISDSDLLSSAFWGSLSNSLFQHGFFLYNNLERGIPYSNNHYASDLAGLLYLGVFFSDTLLGKKWYSFAKKEYYKEVIKQTLPSGVNYERSISYHRMMTEIFSAMYYLLKRKGEIVPEIVRERIEKMYGFVKTYMKSNGYAPQIEDNDDGRFIPFVKRDFRDHNYLLNRESLELRMMRAGVEDILKVISTEDYSDAGHWIYRFGDAYLFVTNGGQSRVDQGERCVTTHTHNDLLSFELALGCDDIIIDPGTYQYLFSSDNNPQGRNEFRSSEKHNTIMVDGEEQHILSNKNLFSIRKNSLIDNANSYHTIEGNMYHKRSFEKADDHLIITDNLEKQGANHQMVSRFHLAPSIKVELKGQQIELQSSHYCITLCFSACNPLNVIIKEDVVSPSYGVLVPSNTIEIQTTFTNSEVVTTTIQWKKMV